MIKTLHITGVAAVIIAGIVLASVLGFLKPASLLHLSLGARDDQQTEKILGSPSAADRFKALHGDKPDMGQDSTPPLIKQAEQFASIINPPAQPGAPVVPTFPGSVPGKAIPTPIRPSSKFDLVGTCYSRNNSGGSFAYIRLPDNTYQWVPQGSTIGHLVIKEIKKDSIVCSDGRQDTELPVEQPPDTANMLTGGASSTPASSAGATPNSPVKQAMASSQTSVPGSQPSLAQVTQDEKDTLSDLVNRLKAESGGSPAEQAAAQDKLIAEYKSARVSEQEAEKLGTLGEQLNGTKSASKDASPDERRREFLRRVSMPRSLKN